MSPKSKKSEVPADKLALYDKLVSTNQSVERKGVSLPYTAANGNMFSFLTKEGRLALRLPTKERDAFLEKYKTRLCEQNGTTLKEYVEVPDELLAKTGELEAFFAVSYAYVSSLKPKKTR